MRWFAAAIAIGVATTGCAARSRPATEPLVPTTEQARGALVVALDAWKADRPVGLLEGSNPGVGVVDTERQPGRPLIGYEILGPLANDGARCFAVRQEVSGGDGPVVVRYLVMGDDPLWVFRLEDYERIAHWEHKMGDEEPPPPSPAPTATEAATDEPN